MPTRTDYSILGGGGKGYVNIGGWNTTLTDRSTSQKEVPGTKRREGANIYQYGLQGAASVAGSGRFMMFAAPAADADNLTSPIVFTALGAVGTDNPYIVKAISICTCDTNTYGWYFKEGILTVCFGASSGGVVAEGPFCVAESASANVVATCTMTMQGVALTAVASGASGQAWISLAGQGKGGYGVF